MRAFRLVSLVVLVACGADHEPPARPTSHIDRSAAARPTETLVEVSLEGGDAALATLIAKLPPDPLRAGLPSRIAMLLDGLIDTPPEIRAHVASTSPLRLLMMRVDGETRSAVAVRLDARLPPTAHAGDGPRGSDRVGERCAVDEQIAVVTDDPVMLERAFAYLAYTALPRASTEGSIVLSVPAATLATTLRAALERSVSDERASLMESIAAARTAHARPPDLGDPEALVTLLADAALARIAYLPDLGDASVTLSPTASGLALDADASVTAASPLALALADYAPISPTFVSAMPSSSALVIAAGTTPAARTRSGRELGETLAAIAGDRLGAAEHVALDDASRAITALSGDARSIALGASDANFAFAILLTRGGTEVAAPTPWGRLFPWTSALLGALLDCTPVSPRATSSLASICGDVALATQIAEGTRADAIGRDAAALADAARRGLASDAAATSPDLARDLLALPSSTSALAIVRPLRALPLLSLLFGALRPGLPRGDGAIVLALAPAATSVRLTLRASSAGLADLAAVIDLFSQRDDE